MVLFSVKSEEPTGIRSLPVVSEFSEVFPEDISEEIRLRRKVEDEEIEGRFKLVS